MVEAAIPGGDLHGVVVGAGDAGPGDVHPGGQPGGARRPGSRAGSRAATAIAEVVMISGGGMVTARAGGSWVGIAGASTAALELVRVEVSAGPAGRPL